MSKKGGPLRKIAVPFVVVPPMGASIRTRIHQQGTEQEFLIDVGTLLGHYYRVEVSDRIRAGTLSKEELKERRATHKREMTSATSARWAGTIVGAAGKQYRLSMDALKRDIDTKTSVIAEISKRLAAPVGEVDEKTGKQGYKDKREYYLKSLRVQSLTHKLVDLNARKTSGCPKMTVGTNALWKKRNNLDAANMTEVQWREEWDAKRMFITANGSSDEQWGNLTIRVAPNPADPTSLTGILSIKTPGALVSKWGERVTFVVPVNMDVWRGTEWRDRMIAGQSLTYRVWYNTKNQHWYLDVSWSIKPCKVPTVKQLGSQDRLGIDFNEGHLDGYIVDRYGNPKGPPVIIPLVTKGLSKGRRDAVVRQAVTDLLNYAKQHGMGVVSIENLGFTDSLALSKETKGRGKKGKKFRAVVAGLPTAQFRDRLTAMAYRAGLWIIAVDPAYTSKWGKEHWLMPLQARHKKESSSPPPSSHSAAGLVVGRRSVGLRARRKPEGPRNRQRTVSVLSPEPASTCLVLNGSTIEPVHPRTVSPNGQPDKAQKMSVVGQGSSTVREPVTVLPTVTN